MMEDMSPVSSRISRKSIGKTTVQNSRKGRE
jgi:hypothetical protein